jgi:ankyrin repeat protein
LLYNFCFEASTRGHSKAVKILLENGADIEKKDKDGCTPLIWGKCKNSISNLLK